MANEQLRAAIEQAGIEIEDLAAAVQVDTKTIQRWISGRNPYRRHRLRVAKALNRQVSELWPEDMYKDPPRPPEAGVPSHDPDFPAGTVAVDWTQLLADATTQIDLLDYTLLEILATPGTVAELAEKARAGCQIRILVAAPYSTAVNDADLELGLREGWSLDGADGREPEPHTRNEALAAREILQDLLHVPGIEIREFIAHRYNTVLRFDDEMLVLLHLFGVRTTDAPRLRCSKGGEDELFDRFSGHFDAIWQTAHQIDFIPTDDDLSDLPPDPDRALTSWDYERELDIANQQLEQNLRRARRDYDEEVADIELRRAEGRKLEQQEP